MKNGEVIDLGEYKRSKKIKKLNNKVSEKKRSFLNWFNELPLEIRKRAEEIGVKRLEIIRTFENKFHFSQTAVSEAEIELGKKTKDELLETIRQADLNNIKQEEAIKLFVATKKIIYQENTNEE